MFSCVFKLAGEGQCGAEEGGGSACHSNGEGRCPDLGEEATEEKSDSLSREQSGGREADALGTDGGRDELHQFGDNLHLIGGAGAAERPEQARDCEAGVSSAGQQRQPGDGGQGAQQFGSG